MNGPEKSDFAIVAMKPANKAGAPEHRLRSGRSEGRGPRGTRATAHATDSEPL